MYICVGVGMHTHTHTYIYICVCVCVLINTCIHRTYPPPVIYAGMPRNFELEYFETVLERLEGQGLGVRIRRGNIITGIKPGIECALQVRIICCIYVSLSLITNLLYVH